MPLQRRHYADASNAINNGNSLSGTLAASACEKPIRREFCTDTI